MTTSEFRQFPADSIGGINVTLTRKKQTDCYTIGVLHIKTQNLVWSCFTLELPWLNNKPQISCIPKGKYPCFRVKSSKFGDTFEIANVPCRMGILFHAGNSKKDTKGCVLLGTAAHTSGDYAYLEASRAAMRTFREMLEGIDTFTLEIK